MRFHDPGRSEAADPFIRNVFPESDTDLAVLSLLPPRGRRRPCEIENARSSACDIAVPGPAVRSELLRAFHLRGHRRVAKRFPDMNFLVYHSGFVSDKGEGAYDAQRSDGIDALRVYDVPEDVVRAHTCRDAVALARDSVREHPEPESRTYGPRTRREFLNLKARGG